MIQSMTGFATKTLALSINDEKLTVLMYIKSLNTRFFEVTCKLPSILSMLETEFIKRFKKKLYRGHVYFTIHLRNHTVFYGAVTPSIAIVKSYISAIDQIKAMLKSDDSITLDHILHLPNIFNAEEKAMNDKTIQHIFTATDVLINQLTQVREDEGAYIKKDIEKHAQQVKQEIETIENLAYHVIEQHKIKVHETLQDIGTDESLLAASQKNALYSMLDKIDIHEEITRFKSHLINFTQHVVSETVEKGKQLDFILQELNREINTIASKCSDATISLHAINIKVELEKIREQVQNII